MHGILYYSTISGNTRLVGEALKNLLAHAGILLTLQDVAENQTWQSLNNLPSTNFTSPYHVNVEKSPTKDESQETLDSYSFILFGCGTYGHGQMEKSIRKVLEEDWKNIHLDGFPCAAIGLGDHRYDVEYNMYAANMIEEWARDHGGRIICPPLKINRSPLKSENQKIIESWAEKFSSNILGISPMKSS